MKKIALFAVVMLAFVSAVSAQAPDFNGKWEGTLTGIRADGSTGNPNPMEMNLTQKGKVLTGTAGPNAEMQWKIEKGAVSGNKATFEVTQTSNGVLHKFTVTLDNGKITGDILSELNGETRKGKMEATKAKAK